MGAEITAESFQSIILSQSTNPQNEAKPSILWPEPRRVAEKKEFAHVSLSRSKEMAFNGGGGSASPSFRPPSRTTPTGLSLALNTSPSLRPPTSNRLRANLLPTLSIQTSPSLSATTPQSTVPLTPSTADDSSSPSPAIVIENDFGRQVRKCIGDENHDDSVSGAFERMNISTSADGDDEATPPARDVLTEEIGNLDEEGWRKAAREGGIVEVSILGEGSSGSVSRCRLRHGTQEFALKTIPADPQMQRQILRELSFNRSCDSPHIVRYYTSFLTLDSSSIAICMEYCAGRSLDNVYKQVKKRGGRTGERVLGKIAVGVLGGLSYLHERKIIHRDIKPSNILITKEGNVKLCDFGVSGELVDSLAGTFTGTSYYMAPERIRGEPYTVASDVWSLALSLMEVAQNRFPFPPDGEAPLLPIELLQYIVNNPVEQLQDEAETGVKWSGSFKHFLKSCLERDYHRRPSPRQLLNNHPWVVGMAKKEVDMERWIREVWQWPA